MSRFKCVIFDMGGTLFEDDASLKKCSNERFQRLLELNYNVNEEEYHEAISKVSSQFDERYAGDYRRFKFGNFMQMVFEYLGEEYEFEDAKELDKTFWEARIRNQKPREGADEIIQYCIDNGIKIGIITNGNELMTSRRLSKLEVDEDVFEEIIFSTDIKAEKSTLEPFQIFLEKTGLKAEECLMVGDRKDEDMLAKELGMETVHISREKDLAVQDEIEPTYSIGNLLELKNIFQ